MVSRKHPSLLLRRALLRELARGKWSLLAALTGISVAVASVTAVHLLNSRVEQNLAALQPAGLPERIARSAHSPHISVSAYGELGTRLARGQLAGVRALVPLIEGSFDGGDGGDGGWRILGLDWLAMRGVNAADESVRLNRGIDFTGLLTTRSVLVHESIEDSELPPPLSDLTVLGSHTGADTRLLIADIATASELLKQRDLSAIALSLQPQGSRIMALLNRLFVGLDAVRSSRPHENPLGADYVVSTPNEEFPVRRFLSAIMFNLGVLSIVCLLVAGFIACQSAVGMALRRQPLIHIFTAMGTQTSTISRLIYTESAMFGGIACLVGMPLGIAAAHLALAAGNLGSDEALAIDAWLLAKACLVAVGIPLLGTRLAMRGQPTGHGGRITSSAAVSGRSRSALLASGCALTAVAIGVFTALPGAFLILGGVCLLLVQAAWLGMRWISRLRLTALRVRTRHVLRAASTQAQQLFPVVGALILALSVALAMQLMVSNLKRDFEAFLDLRLEGDLVLTSPTNQIAAKTAQAISRLPDVQSVRRVESADARVGGVPVQVRLIDYTPAELARYGARADTPPLVALINGQLARLLHTRSPPALDPRATAEHMSAPATALTLTGSFANHAVPVAKPFNDLGAPAPRIVMSRTLWSHIFAHTRIEALHLGIAPAATERIRAQVEQEFALSATSVIKLRENAREMLRDTFWVSDALSLLALLIAVFGMVTGCNQLYLARLGEFRLLRAVGMSSRQLLTLVLAQAGTLALLAAPFWLALGLFMSWMLCTYINPLAFGFLIGMGPDWPLLLLFTSIGLLVAPLASLLAWRLASKAAPVATSDERT